MRPSQSICSGTAMSCLAVKALSVFVCAPHTHSSRGCIPNRTATVLFDPVSVVSVRAPGFSLQVSPSVTCSGL